MQSFEVQGMLIISKILVKNLDIFQRVHDPPQHKSNKQKLYDVYVRRAPQNLPPRIRVKREQIHFRFWAKKKNPRGISAVVAAKGALLSVTTLATLPTTGQQMRPRQLSLDILTFFSQFYLLLCHSILKLSPSSTYMENNCDCERFSIHKQWMIFYTLIVKDFFLSFNSNAKNHRFKMPVCGP